MKNFASMRALRRWPSICAVDQDWARPSPDMARVALLWSLHMTCRREAKSLVCESHMNQRSIFIGLRSVVIRRSCRML